MTKPKNPQTNPIEEAIGDRAKTPEDLKPVAKTPETPSRVLRDAPEQPLSQNEMVDLEELNRQTEERFLEHNDPEPQVGTLPQDSVTVPQETTTIPVSKPNLQPETETSSQESQPPQKIDEIDEYQDAEKFDIPKIDQSGPAPSAYQEFITPAEDKDLVTLREYILDNGFTVAGVAMHIVVLCAQPMVTPATPDWDFVDRAHIPDMVFALLRQPGYLEGIWPSLRVVMGTNKANYAWTAGIATTLAFFDVIRILPTLKDLKNEKKS